MKFIYFINGIFDYLTKVKCMNLSLQLLIILKNILISAPRHLAVFAAHGTLPTMSTAICMYPQANQAQASLYFTWAACAIYGAREDERLVIEFPEPCCLGHLSSWRNKAMAERCNSVDAFWHTPKKQACIYVQELISKPLISKTHFKNSFQKHLAFTFIKKF